MAETVIKKQPTEAPPGLPAAKRDVRPPNRTWLGLICIAALLAAAYFFIGKADQSKPSDWNESRLTYLPSGKMLKPFVMDLDEAAGDLVWINAMMYFADAYLEQKSYQWLGHMLDVVTILNPHFYAAYEFSGVVLTKEKKEIPKTMKLLDRWIREFPKDWKLRLYAALAQLNLDSNYVQAAEYLKPIALDRDVPDHIRTLCSTFLEKGGGRRVALAFLVNSYRHSTNTINQEIFIDKILGLYPGPPEEEGTRKDAVTRILRKVTLEPVAELMALGITHEYLSGTLSPRSRELMDLLYGETGRNAGPGNP